MQKATFKIARTESFYTQVIYSTESSIIYPSWILLRQERRPFWYKKFEIVLSFSCTFIKEIHQAG